ncbi:MAG: hypothetical protein ABS69_20110 [Nitrosomonadales bacterium SCN 54-20]|nr:MAG: hypothetical protein ABS69_20110 [Nitrosomonadales bacterium SCN 54-20]
MICAWARNAAFHHAQRNPLGVDGLIIGSEEKHADKEPAFPGGADEFHLVRHGQHGFEGKALAVPPSIAPAMPQLAWPP